MAAPSSVRPTRRFRRVVAAAVAVVCLWPASASAAAMPWPAELVAGYTSDVAAVIDAHGDVHALAVGPNRALTYITDRSGMWATVSLGAQGTAPAIAVDSTGRAHVAYVGGAYDGIWYATDRSGSWVGTRLTDSGADRDPSIAVDPAGEAHIAFARIGTGIYYATDRRGYWQIQQRSARSNEGQPAIALRGDRRVSIVAVAGSPDSPGLVLMTDVSGSWVRTRISTGADADPAIAVDSSGKLHIASRRSSSVSYRTNASGSWVSKSWSGSEPPSISLDAAGKPHVAWATRHATDASGSWVVESLPVTSRIVALRVRTTGRIRIVIRGYYSIWASDEDAPSWRRMSVATAAAPSSAIGPGDSFYVAYAGGSPEGLRYRRLTGSTWTTVVVEETAFEQYPPQSVSIAVDGAGKVHLAYLRRAIYDSDVEYDLEYRTNEGGTWVTTILRHAPRLACPAIAVTAGGVAHIVVRDGDVESGVPETLTHLTDASGSWLAGAAPPVSGRTGCPSIDLSASGKVDLAYLRGLRPAYVTDRSGSWKSTPLGAVGDSAPRLATDGDGRVHLAFTRPGDVLDGVGGLFYASNATGSWSTVLVGPDCETEAAYGITVAIAVGSAGPPQLACTARTGGVDSIDKIGGSWTTHRVSLYDGWYLPGVPSMQVTSTGAVRIVADRLTAFDILRP